MNFIIYVLSAVSTASLLFPGVYCNVNHDVLRLRELVDELVGRFPELSTRTQFGESNSIEKSDQDGRTSEAPSFESEAPFFKNDAELFFDGAALNFGAIVDTESVSNSDTVTFTAYVRCFYNPQPEPMGRYFPHVLLSMKVQDVIEKVMRIIWECIPPPDHPSEYLILASTTDVSPSQGQTNTRTRKVATTCQPWNDLRKCKIKENDVVLIQVVRKKEKREPNKPPTHEQLRSGKIGSRRIESRI